MFEEKIELYKGEEINNLIELMKFKSISEETGIELMPFGEECSKSLDYILKLGQQMGFKVKNINGYCGYIEFGEGKEMLGIIGHLDVVPANKEDGWTTDPFIPEIMNNKIYGRGAIDDKGPVIASLYAMKAVAETCKLQKRVRLILGLNEEKDWKCINYYKLNEEIPTIGFSPDANFPCIYAEKSIITGKFINDLDLGEDTKIISVDCGNNAVNVVPKYCSIILEYYSEKAKNKFLNLNNITTTILNENTLKLETFGISAHAAHPELGDNAITKMLENLPENNFINEFKNKGVFKIASPEYLGGKATLDESGELTSNIGRIELNDRKVCLTINFRVPVNTSFEFVKSGIEKLKLDLPEMDFELNNSNPKLYVPKDTYLVKTLCGIFNEFTGGNEEPLAIGGGTYARAFKNCISFGATMPGEPDLCHQVNENISIENLIISTKIYAKAIYELAK